MIGAMTEADTTRRTLEQPKVGKITELFPYEMPFAASRVIGLIILLLFVVVATGTIVVKVPETVRCPFVLVPEGGAAPVKTPFQGALEEVRTAQGESVEQGQVLFVIRSAEIHTRHTELRALEEDLRALEQREASLEKDFATRRKLREAEVAQREKEVAYQGQYLEAHRDFLKRMEELQKAGLASPVDMLSQQLGLAQAERDVAIAQQAHEMAQLSLLQLETSREMQITELGIERSKATVHVDALRRQLRDCEGDVVHVRAPYDGTVLALAVRQAGDVVAFGQELGQLARADATPRARLSVVEQGLPRLRVGQTVKLYLDAFPYQRYGTSHGILEWVSPAAVASAAGEEFVAYVRLEQLAMKVRGEARPLRVGMGGEARVSVGRRTLIEYAFERLRQLGENMAEPGARKER